MKRFFGLLCVASALLLAACENVDVTGGSEISVDPTAITVDQNETIVNVKVSTDAAWYVTGAACASCESCDSSLYGSALEVSCDYSWVVFSSEKAEAEGTISILIDAMEGTEGRHAHYIFWTTDKKATAELVIDQCYVSPAYIYEAGVQTSNLSESGCTGNYAYIVIVDGDDQVPSISFDSALVSLSGEMQVYTPQEVGGYDIGEPDEDDDEDSSEEGGSIGSIEPDDDDEYADGSYGVVYELNDLVAPLGSSVYVWYFDVAANKEEEVLYHELTMSYGDLSATVTVSQDATIAGEDYIVDQSAMKSAFTGISDGKALSGSYLLGNYEIADGAYLNIYFEACEGSGSCVLKHMYESSPYMIRFDQNSNFRLWTEVVDASEQVLDYSVIIRKAQILLNDYSAADQNSFSVAVGELSKGSDIELDSSTRQTINWLGRAEGSAGIDFCCTDASKVLVYGFILRILIEE